MPLYEYACGACGERFELIQKMLDPAPEQCPRCGKGPVQKQFSSPAIQFKGSGFYITDYARKGPSSDGAPADKTDKADKAEKTEKTEKKGDAADAGTKTEKAPAAPAPAKAASES